MFDAPFRDIFLLDVILKYVEETWFTRLPFLLFRLRMQEQVILSDYKILSKSIGWCFLTEIDEEAFDVDKPVLNSPNFSASNRIFRQ
ncbi:unknown [Prevotella sp. CAG:1031]|nr:unknown [Prevotella sp. CAG:1031]